jgi:hypothetical protein
MKKLILLALLFLIGCTPPGYILSQGSFISTSVDVCSPIGMQTAIINRLNTRVGQQWYPEKPIVKFVGLNSGIQIADLTIGQSVNCHGTAIFSDGSSESGTVMIDNSTTPANVTWASDKQVSENQQQAQLDFAKQMQIAVVNPSLNVKSYENDMSSDYRVMFIAMKAKQCGLRSSLWYSIINQGYIQDKINEREKIPLSSLDFAVIQNYESTSFSQSHLDAIDCQAAATSDDLNAADQVETQYAAQERQQIEEAPFP